MMTLRRWLRKLRERVGWIVVLGSTVGCSSFLHWSQAAMPEIAVLCAVGKATNVEAELERIATEYGVPVALVELAFQDACGQAASKDPNGAKTAGLASARTTAMAARKMRARFEPMTPPVTP